MTLGIRIRTSFLNASVQSYCLIRLQTRNETYNVYFLVAYISRSAGLLLLLFYFILVTEIQILTVLNLPNGTSKFHSVAVIKSVGLTNSAKCVDLLIIYLRKHFYMSSSSGILVIAIRQKLKRKKNFRTAAMLSFEESYPNRN
jgi:hypothetical protein